MRQRKVSCINQIIMLHSTHLLENFSLVHNKSLHYKKKYKKRIRQMHFSNLSYVTRVLLGLMALSFITEVLNLKYNSYSWIRTSDFHLMTFFCDDPLPTEVYRKTDMTGIEPATHASVAHCSVQLNYMSIQHLPHLMRTHWRHSIMLIIKILVCKKNFKFDLNPRRSLRYFQGE